MPAAQCPIGVSHSHSEESRPEQSHTGYPSGTASERSSRRAQQAAASRGHGRCAGSVGPSRSCERRASPERDVSPTECSGHTERCMETHALPGTAGRGRHGPPVAPPSCLPGTCRRSLALGLGRRLSHTPWWALWVPGLLARGRCVTGHRPGLSEPCPGAAGP